jgi:hypothetical protein
VLAATVDGTAADEAPDGLRQNGFEKTELTHGEGNEGVVSAIVLAFTSPVTLPINTDSALLRVTLGATVPAGGCAEVGLEFHDGLRGSGQPVLNRITYEGLTRKDDGGTMDLDEDVEESCLVLVCSRDAGRFVRGNCDSSGTINLSDAVFLLNYLFRGGRLPGCLDSCDTNDDAGLNLTDAVYLLLYLFLGGRVPPAPFPTCGQDLTVDPTGCLEAHADCAG